MVNYREYFKHVFSKFENNKIPGNEVSVGFYKNFRPEIGTLLVDSLNYANIHWELSKSHKEALITLIERKKERDRRLMTNIRRSKHIIIENN